MAIVAFDTAPPTAMDVASRHVPTAAMPSSAAPRVSLRDGHRHADHGAINQRVR